MFESSQYQGQTAAQSNRGRKKKNAAASSGSLNQSKMYRQQQQHYGPGQHQFGQRGGSSNFSNQMPPPSMHSLRQSTGMGLGLPSEEDTSDFILDDLDRLTPRSIAIARYKRNHELLSLVFDARRIDSLEPPVSPYADIDQAVLKKDLQTTQDEIEELRQSHAKRIKILKEDFAKQDAYLHDVKKKGKGLSASLEDGVIQATQTEEAEEPIEEQEEEEWAKEPSKGRIVGVGYVRVSTPEEVKALLPKAPVPVAATALPTAAGGASAAEEKAAVPTTMQGEQMSAPLLPSANTVGQEQEQEQSGLGDDSAMTGISLEGGEAEDEAEDDDEEDDEEDEEGDQQAALAGGEDDADAEGDEDADGDADADADADADGDAESISAPQEQALETVAAEESIKDPVLSDTTMLEPDAEVPVDLTEAVGIEAARMEQERELVDEVNRQHDVPNVQETTSESVEAAQEAFNEAQIDAAPALPEEIPMQPPQITTEEGMAVDVPNETESVV